MKRKKLKLLTLMTAFVVSQGILATPFYQVALANDNKVIQENQNVKSVNLARGKAVVSSANETASFTADKVTDGNLSTRWSSGSFNSGQQWIYVDLGSETEFNNIKLYWEAANAKSYRIETSNDLTNWNVIHHNQDSQGGEQLISFDQTQNARYVRVFCETNNPSVWTSVSLYEVEIYNGEIPQTPAQVAEAIKAPVVNKGDTSLNMPEVPEGIDISFIGCDFEQIIDKDMNIVEPLIDTKVIIDFEVSNGENKAQTKGLEVIVPGKYSENTGNEKPNVIPSLREWVGNEGNFSITKNSRIVVDEKYSNDLMKSMEIFKQDYKDITGNDIEIVVGEKPNTGDFYFTLDTEDTSIGNEGYYLYVDDYLKVEGIDNKGIFYSTRSILQILKQTGTTIAKGTARDFPRYETRGFFLDVGRKYFTPEFIEEYVKLMSWYKMSDFQLHLNDNEIWFYEDYEDWNDAYSAFRLESEVYPELTAKDGHYTKEKFGQIIDMGTDFGVEIIPEIDTPAHSLAFTKLFPELRQGDGKQADHLDVGNPEVFNMLDPLFDEYLKGDNPVFRNNDFHIGVDEYTGNNEAFRAYADRYLKYTTDTGRDARLWGSFTARPGTTPVRSENVEMNIWNIGWADPVQAINEGYEIINTDDSNLYIVPEANYYRNYLNYKSLYDSWEPNTFRGNYSYKIPAGHPQLKGGMFAVWNDLIGARESGVSALDVHDRVLPSVQVLSEKMWASESEKGYNDFKELAQKIDEAPNTNIKHDIESKGDTIVDYSFDNVNNEVIEDESGNKYNATLNNASVAEGKVGKAIKLSGDNSFVDIPLENKGPNYTVSMWVKKEKGGNEQEQILAESSLGALKAVQKETGKVGFTRENIDFSFDYRLPEDEWVHLSFVGQLGKTSLYVNNELTSVINKASGGLVGTFTLPLDKLGSETNSFKGIIDEFEVSRQAITNMDPTIIPQSSMRASASSEEVAAGNEGLARYAIDGNENSMWHTKWVGGKDELPQHITLDLGDSYTINKLTYQPRISNTNGIITEYEVYVSNDGTNFEKISQGTLAADSTTKKIEFEPTQAKYVRLLAKQGIGGFATIAELNVHKIVETLPVEKPDKPSELKATSIDKNSIEISWNKPENTTIKEYIIYKDGKEFERVTDTNHRFEDLKANKIYGFKVVAVGSDGQKSKPVSITVRTTK